MRYIMPVVGKETSVGIIEIRVSDDDKKCICEQCKHREMCYYADGFKGLIKNCTGYAEETICEK